MIEGLHRTDVPYVWPPTITREDSGVRLVYLDLNHWIGLAKAATGHRDGGRYQELLDLARRQHVQGESLFPLSGQHYMELAVVRDPRQRRDVGAVMEELSGFSTLLCRSLVMRLELEAVLDEWFGRRREPYAELPLVGFGFGRAFGIKGELRIRDDHGDTTDHLRASWPDGPDAFDAWLFEFKRLGERIMLVGPETREQVEALEALGWNPMVGREGQERRAFQEREQAARLDADPRWRRGRLRDVVSARYIIVELFDILVEALAARGLALDDIERGPQAIRRLVDSMPSGDVHVTLQVSAHRNRDEAWTPNDFFDIDALSLAVAYCDYAATDRHRAHALTAAGCATRLQTTVVATPAELVSVLG